MARRGTSDSKSRSTGRPCAGCGKIIYSGLYCPACLEKFRERAKTQSRHMELLKTSSLKKVAAERREVIILIAISDERNLSITKLILERGLPEYKVLATNNILSTINTLVSREVSLVILDADYNGLDMLGRIRDDEKFRDTPVMIMSSSTERDLVTRVFALGVQDFVTKPCSPDDLVARVNKMLNVDETATASAAETQSKSTFTILLVDDDIFDLRQERDKLQHRLPCEIVTAQSAVEGMRVLENRGVDLVLVSLDMPFVNGLKFLELVGENNKLKNIPVIIMTDSRDFKILTEIERSAAAGYIRKPNITEDGLALIESKLRRRRR
ncbi:MAG: response regulator [Selenomonadaceae bacterium]|nr:response regulator [Selenomonadaceae bacterium]